MIPTLHPAGKSAPAPSAPPPAVSHAEAVASANALSAAQTAHARAIKLRKLEQRDPMIRAAFTEFRQRIAALEKQLAETDAQHGALAVEASRLTEDSVALRQQLDAREREVVDLKEKLAAALKPKRGS